MIQVHHMYVRDMNILFSLYLAVFAAPLLHTVAAVSRVPLALFRDPVLYLRRSSSPFYPAFTPESDRQTSPPDNHQPRLFCFLNLLQNTYTTYIYTYTYTYIDGELGA
jgi:hypothetical protein